MSPPVEDHDLGFARAMVGLRALGQKQITIGVHGEQGEEEVKIATIHEFGTRAWRPSWKQAYFLAVQIVRTSEQDASGKWQERRSKSGRRAHLKGDLTAEQAALAFTIARSLRKRTLRIPERSFLRAPFDAKQDKISRAADNAVGKVLDGDLDAVAALQQLAVGFLEPLFQGAFLHVQPANAPLTVALKKSSRPLVDTGRLRQSIRAVVGQAQSSSALGSQP